MLAKNSTALWFVLNPKGSFFFAVADEPCPHLSVLFDRENVYIPVKNQVQTVSLLVAKGFRAGHRFKGNAGDRMWPGRLGSALWMIVLDGEDSWAWYYWQQRLISFGKKWRPMPKYEWNEIELLKITFVHSQLKIPKLYLGPKTCADMLTRPSEVHKWPLIFI